MRLSWARIISEKFSVTVAKNSTHTLDLLIKASEIIGITINGITINETDNWIQTEGTSILLDHIPYELAPDDTIEVRYKPV